MTETTKKVPLHELLVLVLTTQVIEWKQERNPLIKRIQERTIIWVCKEIEKATAKVEHLDWMAIQFQLLSEQDGLSKEISEALIHLVSSLTSNARSADKTQDSIPTTILIEEKVTVTAEDIRQASIDSLI